MHHVILGAGPAGVTAAETIRKNAPDAEITLVGGEGEPPYSRMAIPYLLEGKIDEGGTYLRQADGHYDAQRIAYLQANATGIDTSAKTVTLSDGASLTYDKLLIATGASPIRPPVEGLDQPGVHTCWTLADARHIQSLAEKGEPVVLVGAGFIGSIILEALAKKGVKLTVVEMGDRMVPRMLDETAGNMLKRWCEKQGVRVATGTTVEAIRQPAREQAPAEPPPAAAPQAPQSEPGFFSKLFGLGGSSVQPATTPQPAPTAPPPAAADGNLQVVLGNGETIDAKLVVIAAGVRSNTAFLDGSGIDVGDGIKVDEHLATSAADVYAAGDVAEGMDLSTKSHDMLAIQPVAVEHGYIAGLNMAGLATVHRGSLNMNVLDTLGLISSSFGLWQGAGNGDNATLVDEDGWRYLRLEFDGDKLVGAQAVGLTDHVGMLRGLIQSGLALGAWKARLKAAPERLPEAYVAVSQGTPLHGPTRSNVALPV